MQEKNLHQKRMEQVMKKKNSKAKLKKKILYWYKFWWKKEPDNEQGEDEKDKFDIFVWHINIVTAIANLFSQINAKKSIILS